MDGQVVFQYQGVDNVTQLSQNSSSEEVSVWKYRMELLLEEHDCWEAVSEEHCLQWEYRDKTARLLIVKTLSDDIVLLTKGKTAKQMWEALVDKFEKGNLSIRITISRCLEGGKSIEKLRCFNCLLLQRWQVTFFNFGIVTPQIYGLLI